MDMHAVGGGQGCCGNGSAVKPIAGSWEWGPRGICRLEGRRMSIPEGVSWWKMKQEGLGVIEGVKWRWPGPLPMPAHPSLPFAGPC